ncbi:MAG: hypothetical protein FWF38_03375 [Spirochaetaceae bacterium]|nr:hypothetical protein [Spirochaetaceae bacterium]
MGNKRDFRKDYRNKNRGNFNNPPREKPEENKIILKCEICMQDIQDISSAIALPETGNPAHFDCVLKRIKENENLREKEQLVYLGSGTFGIIENISTNQNPNFKIIRKIDFEDHENIPEWRKQMIKVKI